MSEIFAKIQIIGAFYVESSKPLAVYDLDCKNVEYNSFIKEVFFKSHHHR